MARGDNPGVMGRPRIEIDWTEFDKLCGLQCTLVEIASWFDCSEDTIENRVKEAHGVTFSEYSTKKRAKGKISLRRKQFRLADTSAAMAIFLGKNYLDQRDSHDLEFSKKPTKAFDTSKMSKAEYIEFMREQLKQREGSGDSE